MAALRLRLLVLMAGAAALSVITSAVGAVGAATPEPATRLGVAIQKDVSAQEAAATRRNRALDLREAAAKATEERLKAELAQRPPAGKPGAAALAPDPDEQYDSLARVYQAMKPARAAVIFEQLDLDVQMQVAKRMRERSTAMIMAAMNPRHAATLSMALARKSSRARSPEPAVVAAVPAPALPAQPAAVAAAPPKAAATAAAKATL